MVYLSCQNCVDREKSWLSSSICLLNMPHYYKKHSAYYFPVPEQEKGHSILLKTNLCTDLSRIIFTQLYTGFKKCILQTWYWINIYLKLFYRKWKIHKVIGQVSAREIVKLFRVVFLMLSLMVQNYQLHQKLLRNTLSH